MAESFVFESSIMWSQLDANMHLRHSAYADFAAQARIELLNHMGISSDVFKQYNIGPVLFREELLYLKEVRPDDTIRMTCELTKLSEDKSRWSFIQKMYRGDGMQVATINVDGAWIDLGKRKLAKLAPELMKMFDSLPIANAF